MKSLAAAIVVLAGSLLWSAWVIGDTFGTTNRRPDDFARWGAAALMVAGCLLLNKAIDLPGDRPKELS